jgi:hypothetical protein
MSRPEHARLVLHLSGDERLIGGVGAALAHFAARVGLGAEAGSPVVAAVERLCRQTLPLLRNDQEMLDVAIEDFDDRIEIVLEHPGEARRGIEAELARGTASGQASGRSAAADLARTVDSVECQARNGSVRTVLVKYFKS